MLLERAGEPVPQVKLLDFGVAKIREAKDGAVAVTIPDSEGGLSTKAGALMGTPAYMAPEQAHDPASVDLRADIYAVGILLFEALCAQRPFSGQTVGELIGAHLFQAAEKPSVVAQRKGLPPRHLSWRQLDAVVEKALAKQAGNRFATCDSLRQELELAWRDRGLWAAVGQGYAAPSGLSLRGSARRSARAWLAGAALAALGLSSSSALWLSHARRSAQALAAAQTPQARATARLQAAQHGGVAERRGLIAAVDLVRSRALLPYVEAALRDPAAAVWPLAVPVVEAIGRAGDAALGELLAQRAAQANRAVAVDIAAAQLQLGAPAAVPALQAAASGEPGPLSLRAMLALSRSGQAPAAALQRALAASERVGSVPAALRQATLVQLVKLGDATTEAQLQKAMQGQAPTADGQDALEAADESLAVYARAGRAAVRAQLVQTAQAAAGARRLGLAVALAEAADGRAVELLLPLLADATPRVRQRAAGALGSLGAAGATGAPALARLLDDPDPGVALTAAAALLAVSPSGGSTALASARGDGSGADG